MSYILDALKKSERERQRGQAPTLSSIHDGLPVQPRRNLLPLVLLLGGVTAATGLILGLWWGRPGVSPSHESPAPQVQAAVPVLEPAQPRESVPARAPTAGTDAAAAVEEAVLPPRALWELPDDVQRALPAMTFSFHVFAREPERRTIIINNRRLREGDRVAEGVLLEEITEDGVVLRHRRHRVHIPVLEDW